MVVAATVLELALMLVSVVMLAGLAVAIDVPASQKAKITRIDDRKFFDNSFIMRSRFSSRHNFNAIEYSRSHLTVTIFSFLHDILPLAIEPSAR